MRVISMFFKNRRKKRLLEQIYTLKEEAAQLNSSAQVAKQNAAETKNYVALCQKQAAAGDFSSSVYLSCYLKEHLKTIQTYENKFATFNQRYLNTLDKIKHLEEELKNL